MQLRLFRGNLFRLRAGGVPGRPASSLKSNFLDGMRSEVDFSGTFVKFELSPFDRYYCCGWPKYQTMLKSEKKQGVHGSAHARPGARMVDGRSASFLPPGRANPHPRHETD